MVIHEATIPLTPGPHHLLHSRQLELKVIPLAIIQDHTHDKGMEVKGMPHTFDVVLDVGAVGLAGLAEVIPNNRPTSPEVSAMSSQDDAAA